jgi:hypothetical protein
MGGSRRIARMAFMWGLIACGAVETAQSQSADRAKPEEAQVAPSLSPSTKSNAIQEPVVSGATSSRSALRAGPWLPQPWQPVQATAAHDDALGDQHVIVITTLGLIIIGAILVLVLL